MGDLVKTLMKNPVSGIGLAGNPLSGLGMLMGKDGKSDLLGMLLGQLGGGLPGLPGFNPGSFIDKE